jgi:hypothetical protein
MVRKKSTCIYMPVLSDSHRDYSINGVAYRVPDAVCFKDNCVVSYDQLRLDQLEERVNKVLHIMDETCPDDYWAMSGTLLGAIRHGSIIPFDDDMDIAITTTGYDLIKCNLINIREKYGIDIIECTCGYKMYYDDNVIGDVFVFDYIDNNKFLVYSGPRIDDVSKFVMYNFVFPYMKFTPSDIFPLKRMRIGQTYVNVPNYPYNVLTVNYGSECLYTIIPPRIQHFHDNIFNNVHTSKYVNKVIRQCYNYPETTKLLIVVPQSLSVNANVSRFISNVNLLQLVSNYISGLNLPSLLREIEDGSLLLFMKALPDYINIILSVKNSI